MPKPTEKAAANGGVRRSTKWSFGVGITSAKARDSISRSMQRLDDQYGEAAALAILGAVLKREIEKLEEEKREAMAAVKAKPKKR